MWGSISCPTLVENQSSKCWCSLGQLIFTDCWREWILIQSLWEIIWHFLLKNMILTPRDPAMTFLVMYPRDILIHVHLRICSKIDIAALRVLTTKILGPSTKKMIITLSYIHIIQFSKTVNINKPKIWCCLIIDRTSISISTTIKSSIQIYLFIF